MMRKTRARSFIRHAAALVIAAAAGAATTSAQPPKANYRWEKPVLWDEKDGPEAREHAAVIVDEEMDRALVIGGLGFNPKQLTPLDDVWQFSLKVDKWARVKPAAPAPPGGSRRVAQVPGSKVAYLFGGVVNNQLKQVNQLIQVDFSKDVPEFSEVPQDDPPAPRLLHAFAYDPKLGRFVLFGGMSGDLFAGTGVVFNDVWTMKLVGGRAKWTKVKVEGGPSPRSGFAYAYDTKGGRLIVFGGSQSARDRSNEASDTWVLHLREEPPTWHEWKDGAAPPRRNACFAWDQANTGCSSSREAWVTTNRPGGICTYSTPSRGCEPGSAGSSRASCHSEPAGPASMTPHEGASSWASGTLPPSSTATCIRSSTSRFGAPKARRTRRCT